MTANTANKGYIYQTASDAPASFPGVFGQFATQVDTNSGGYDADAARIQANNFVKLSANNYLSGVNAIFDTVEVNRGTPTDLTLYNGLILGAGMWLVGGSYTIQCNASNGLTGIVYGVQVYQALPSFLVLACRYTRDTGSALAAGTVGTAIGWPNQTLSVVTPYYVASGTARITMGLGNQSENMPYADLWAWQVGDV